MRAKPVWFAVALVALGGEARAQTPADSLIARASESRMKGSADAPVVIVELSDFQCPFCREFALNTLPALDSAYVRTGQVRFIYLNFPLPNHPAAWAAAEAALCAGAQGRFWPMHDRLFAQQREWGGAERPGEWFERYAGELGLDLELFTDCTRWDRVAPLLSADLMQASRSGASATPTFVIGSETVLSGAQPFSEFQRAIEAALERRR